MELELSSASVALIPIITALVQIAKQTGMPRRYSPLLALALGVAAGIVYVSPGDIPTGVLVGLVKGMSAVGLYEGVDHSTRPLRKGKGDAAHTA